MEQWRTFLTELYGDIEGEFYLDLRALMPGELPKQEFIHGLDFEHVHKFLMESLKDGRNVYFGVATRRDSSSGQKTNCSYLPGLWVDIDFKDIPEGEALKGLAEFPLKPTMMVQSGGGLHCYFLFKEPVEANGGCEKYLRALARHLGGDLSSAELAHILRIPGTKNYKYEPGRSVKIAENKGVRYDPEDFDFIVTEEDQTESRQRNELGWEKDFIRGVPEGERNVDATKLAGRYMRIGLHPSEVFNMLVGWNSRNGGQLSMEELQAVVASVFKYHPTEEIEGEWVQKCLEQNQDGDAFLFTELNQNKLCFDHSTERWYEFGDDGYWTEDKANNATAAVQGIIKVYEDEARRQFGLQFDSIKKGDKDTAEKQEALAIALGGRVGKLQSPTRKRDVLHLSACGTGSLGITGDEWDCEPWTLACKNGIINLKTGELRKGRPSDYIKTFAPSEWKGLNEPAPTFEGFILEIFNQDRALVEFIQRLLGYSLSRTTIEHHLPICHGKGRNGKGTLFETLSAVLGPFCHPIPSEMLLQQRFARSGADHSADVMALRGKNLVWASETGAGRSLNAGKVKWLVGGDQLVGRPPFGKHIITFAPTHTLLLLTNNKPKAPSRDYALWQRILLIPFTMSFVDRPKGENERKRDPHMSQKLLAETSGILAWLVRGCFLWQEFGLAPPMTVLTATEKYKQEEDQIGNFIEGICVVEDGAKAFAEPLYQAYVKWAEENKKARDEVIGKTDFGKQMKELFEHGRGNQGIFYQGLRLVND